MEKIKNFLNPGHGADDEILYGSGQPAVQGGASNPTEGGSHITDAKQPETLHSKPQAENDKGILRQILNPGNANYDETRYGKTATTEAPRDTRSDRHEEKATGLAAPQNTRNTNDSQQGSTGFGTSTASGTNANQPLTTGQTTDQSTQQHHGRDAAIGAGSGLAASSAIGHNSSSATGFSQRPGASTTPSAAGTMASNASIKSGVLGKAPTGSSMTQDPSHSEDKALPNIPATGGRFMDDGTPNTQQSGDRSFPLAGGQTGNDQPSSHVGRDAALATGAGAAGIGAYQAHKPTDREHPSSASALPPTQPRSGTTTAGHNALSGDQTASRTSDNHAGRDAGLVGGAGAAGIGAHEAYKRHGLGHDQASTTSAAPHSQPTPATNFSLPTSAANREAGGVHPVGNTPGSTSESHHGRDAALAGGAGAAGIGAYEAHKRHTHDQSTTIPQTSTTDTSHGNDGRKGLASAAAAAAFHHDHNGHGHKYEGDPCTPPPPGQSVGGPKFTHGPHVTETANRLDPHNHGAQHIGSGPPQTTQTDQHHHGRDAGIASGAGAAGLGAYEAKKHHDEKQGTHRGEPTPTDPASKTTGPHKSNVLNVLDPRVKPEPEKMKDHTTQGPHHSDTLNKLDKNVDSQPTPTPVAGDHHPGRTSLLAGGAGAAVAGAYPSNPTQSDAVSGGVGGGVTGSEHQPTHVSETKEHHPDRTSLLAGGAGAAVAGAYPSKPKQSDAISGGADSGVVSGERGAIGSDKNPYSSHTLDPRVDSPEHRSSHHPTSTATSASQPKSQGQHHYGRDAGLAGGAGAAGLGAYEAKKHHEEKQHVPSSQTTGQSTGVGAPGSTQPQHKDQHHYGRDAAVTGGTGGAGIGAYEAAKHLGNKQASSEPPVTSATPKASEAYGGQRGLPHHPAQQAGHDYTQDSHQHHKGRDAAAVGAAGAAGVGAEHEISKHDAEKLAKEKQKETEKLEKERHKEAEKRHQQAVKAEKKHEKEVEKEHKPSLISRILHRHKDDKDEEEPTSTDSKHRHEKEAAAAGVGAAGTGAAAHEHNKLHKDPPQNYRQAGSDGQHMGTDGPIGDIHAVSGQNENTTGPHGANVDSTNQNQGIVIEPHTGLPMNVGKYGDGHGGTDATPAIGGFHSGTGTEGAEAGHGAGAAGATATDWEAIKKANTPY